MSVEPKSTLLATYDALKWTLGHLTIGAQTAIDVTSKTISCAKDFLSFGISEIKQQNSGNYHETVVQRLAPTVPTSLPANNRNRNLLNIAREQNMIPEDTQNPIYPGLTEAVLRELYKLEKDPNDPSKDILVPRTFSGSTFPMQEPVNNTEINRLVERAKQDKLLSFDDKKEDPQNRGGSYTTLTGLVLNELYTLENNKISPKHK